MNVIMMVVAVRMKDRQLDYRSASAFRPVSRRAMLRAGFTVVGLAAGYALYGRRGSEKAPAVLPRPAKPLALVESVAIQPAAEASGVRVERVYRESILPVMAAFELRNGAAVGRAIGRLHERVEARRGRVPRFTKDVSSWGTRLGILKRYPSDLWGKLTGGGDTGAVRAYVNEKFRQDIVSELGLRQDVMAVVAQFNEDMAASRNELYAELDLPLKRIKSIVPTRDVSIERIQADVRDRARTLSASLAGDSVAAGLVEFAGGWLAMDAAQAVASRVVGQVLARGGTAMAAEGIAAGGATVEATAAGGGAGSFGGPVGTIIGIGVGLIVGVIVDWRLSKKFEAKIAEQCGLFLDVLEGRLRDGTMPGSGLRGALLETVRLTDEAQAAALKGALGQED